MKSRLICCAAAVFLAIFAVGVMSPSASQALTVCPTSEFTVAFDGNSAGLSDGARETLAAAAARTRACAADVSIAVRAYGPNEPLATLRARAIYEELAGEALSINIREAHLSGCSDAVGDGRAVVMIYFWISQSAEPQVEASCRDD